MRSFDAGQRGELQDSQGLPTQLAQGARGSSADQLPCLAGAAGEGIYRGRNAEGAGLGDRLTQELDQRAVDGRVLDACGCQKELHDDPRTRLTTRLSPIGS